MHWRQHYAQGMDAQRRLAPMRMAGSDQRPQLEPAFLSMLLAIAIVAGLATMMAWQ